MSKSINIAVIGLRGFPGIEGGVENHCEKLYPRITEDLNINLYVFRRSSYIKNDLRTYKNITFIDLYNSKNPAYEAFFHTFYSVLYIVCKLRSVNIVHVHNIGPGLFIPILKLFGFKTVLTYHSDNYKHDKWNHFQKMVLRIGEYFSVKYSDKLIVVSPYFHIKLKRFKKAIYIPNGVDITANQEPTMLIKELTNSKYILFVGRIHRKKVLKF